MVMCSLCKKDLPESDFYPSSLRRGIYQCKKCRYEHYTKKANKKYQEELKELPNIDFDRFYGGLNVKVLNFVRPNEYRFTIESTIGEIFQTNDAKEFMAQLWEELKQRT